MLHLLLGTAKTGKTTRLLRAIGENGPKRPQILIIPEQYSHETEQRLCREQGNEASLYCEALSFTRLANRILTAAGGLAEPVLDGGGRLLLMHEAVTATASSLSVYAKPSKKAAFLQNLLATADELKSYCVLPEQLLQAGSEQSGADGARLHDLGLILGTYDALVAQRAADPRDLLSRVADKLSECDYGRGADFYLDSFTDFTPQQKVLLERLMKRAHSVTVALTCDALEEGLSVYEPCRRTALGLMSLAQESHIGADYEILVGRQDGAPEALEVLEQGLFAEAVQPIDCKSEAVHLITAADPYGEVEAAAAAIRRLLREDGYRCREIAVSARTMDGYEQLIETVFRRYELPVFLGQMEDILEKPILTLLTAALDAIASSYDYDDLFRYLKTGLAGVSMEEVDELENYVLRWDIRGRRWTQEEDWHWHPEGFGQKWEEKYECQVKELDTLRRRIIAPLEVLRRQKDACGGELAQRLYEFLESIQLPERLTERAENLRERGELTQAEEYRQLWDVLCSAMEQCAQYMGEQPMKLSDFAELFRLILSQYSVGSIPVSIDRISVGEMQRFAHKQVKVLFLLGVDDAHFPMVTESQGLLTDEDRAFLAAFGCELAPSADLRLDRESTMAYDAIAMPSERLYLSCPEHTAGGSECRPAWLFGRTQRLLRGISVERPRAQDPYMAPRPALEAAARGSDEETLDALAQDEHWRAQVELVRKARQMERGQLSRESVERLYGREVAMSASKMDVLKSCHFLYFMQYGLKAKSRKTASFDAPALGTFVHAVLEWVLMGALERGGVKALSDKTVEEMTNEAIERYLSEEIGGIEHQSKRFAYLFQRLRSSVHLIVRNVVEELRQSDFQPMEFELGFGRGEDKAMPPVRVRAGDVTLSITGFVDRVDGWVSGERLYLRVVDYKTGKKSFSLTDVWHGLELQMLLYLFTLQERGQQRYGKEVVSAGVLYLPARDIIISGTKGMTPEKLQKKADSELIRSGMLLEDRGVLDAMETVQPGKKGRFLNLSVKRDNTISGKTLATAEQWGIMHRHVKEIIQEIGRELSGGVISADPYLKGDDRSPCDYCDYKEACHFEEGCGNDRRRYLFSVEGRDFWERAKGGDEA